MALPEGLTKQRRQASKFWLEYRAWIIAVIAVLVLAGGANYGWRQYTAYQEEERTREVQGAAKALAQGFSTKFQAVRAKVEEDIEAARLMALVKAGDRTALAAAASGIAERHPEIVAARIVLPDTRQVDRTSKPPLGYAALDMIGRSASSGEAPPAEVHFFGTEDQYVALLWRIEDAGGALGTHLLAALDASRLQAMFDESPLPAGVPAGYAEVRQPVSGARPLVLAKRGRPDLRVGPPAYQLPVAGAAWRVAYWGPAAARRSPGGGNMLLYGGAGAGVLVLLAAVFVIVRRRRAAPSPTLYDGAVARVIVDEDGAEEEDDVLASFDAPPPSAPPLPIVEETDEMPDLAAGSDPAPAAPDGAAASPPPPPAEEGEAPATGMDLPAAIFRAYDIRGPVGEALTATAAREIGRAIGSEAFDRGQQTIVVGRDGRLSGPELMDALVDGLRASGRDVIDIGQVPTPILYFATYYLNTGSGVMVTGSHNPPQYNGFKIMLGEETLFGEHIAALRTRIRKGSLQEGAGNLQVMDLQSEYIRRVSEDIPVALGNAFKIVIDCGNGVAGSVAPKLFRALGHDVIELYCEVDGSFPNHHPDPAQPENLVDLIAAVAENDADIGFAFDGDGDRLGVVDRNGNVIWPDRLMMLYARDILTRVPDAQIVFDVKCSNRLPKVIEKLGGRPLMWKTGHSYMKNKMRETGAELAGEMSGHIFFKERWYGFDDALYSAARLLEILMGATKTPTEVLAGLPAGVSTPELRIDFPEGEHAALMARLEEAADFGDAEVTTIDGIRVDFADGWGLVRASNTTPSLVLRFEGNDEAALQRIQGEFRTLLLGLSPGLELPF